jgi:PTH1 family peptidyl-tRNA hydrolase
LKVIVGLGNPDPQYEVTRHNLGFMVVDAVAERLRVRLTGKQYHGIWGRKGDLALLKPTTYMNESGRAVGALMLGEHPGAGDLLVVHDELDLPFGWVKLKQGGGAGGHRGVASIQAALGHDRFWRLKVGIGKPPRGDTIDYVLAPFEGDEGEKLAALLEYCARFTEAFVFQGPGRAMNQWQKKGSIFGEPPGEQA